MADYDDKKLHLSAEEGRDEMSPSHPEALTKLGKPVVAGIRIDEMDEVTRKKRDEAERKLVRKIDLRMSILIVIYILNYMDRNNMSAARLKGFQDDLKLDDTQYSTCLSILYVGYIYLFLNKIGKPSLYLPTAMMLWGLMSCLTGVVTGYTGAVLCRFFLGFVEAAFFPGALFLLSKWYTRKELALRTAILYVGNLSSNAVNGLIAAGILNNMDGVLGHRSWRWLFYIEGALTIFVALCAIFILPDFPATTRWLTPEEKLLAEQRCAEDTGVIDEDTSKTTAWSVCIDALTDYKVWALAFLMTAEVIGLSFNAFFPTLCATLGYGTTQTLLLAAPPWVFSCIVAFFVSRNADRTGEKFFHITIPLVVGLVGFIIGITTMNTAARYISLFLMAQSYAGLVVTYSWISSTIARPPAKRAVALAGVNAFSQLGNIAGSYVWPAKWGKSYTNSFAICIANFGLAIIIGLVFRFELMRLNRKLDRDEGVDKVDEEALENTARLEGVSKEDILRARKGWRYLY